MTAERPAIRQKTAGKQAAQIGAVARAVELLLHEDPS